jgi:hypothetical protein
MSERDGMPPVLNLPRCVCCGGRGGWWTEAFRETCSLCKGTGWEPPGATRDLLVAAGLTDDEIGSSQ